MSYKMVCRRGKGGTYLWSLVFLFVKSEFTAPKFGEGLMR